LSGANLGITKVPVDPMNEGPFIYQYSTNAGGTSYTVAAQFENTSNPALKASIIGASSGINGCGASGLYCVGL